MPSNVRVIKENNTIGKKGKMANEREGSKKPIIAAKNINIKE